MLRGRFGLGLCRIQRLSHTRTIKVISRYLSDEAASAIDRLKNPRRGGQNLTERYRRLERSVRGKDYFAQQASKYNPIPPPATKGDGDMRLTFKGFVIPSEPAAPESDECCMGGCAVCVYDLYEESVVAYNEALAQLQGALMAAKIPESEWPPQIKPQGGRKKKIDIVRSAFEELELSLKAKREAESGRT